MSNGGEMCYMLACQAYDTFKAVAPVAGMILQDILDECDSAPGIPVFEIHGSQDGVTPLAGDPNNNDGWGAYPSIPFTINYFVEKNECTSVDTQTLPDIDTNDGSFVNSEKHLNGVNNNEVWYYEVVGGGHDWPGAWGNMDINAGEEAWLFFQNHIDNTLSLQNFEDLENTIRVFPNPANSEITLSIENTNDISSYRVYNTLGQLLQTGTLQANKEVISVSKYTIGVYFIVVKNTVTTMESTLRFVKE